TRENRDLEDVCNERRGAASVRVRRQLALISGKGRRRSGLRPHKRRELDGTDRRLERRLRSRKRG
ncbi:MAG: hypothetical protein ACK56I_09595, partial [bacterium]